MTFGYFRILLMLFFVVMCSDIGAQSIVITGIVKDAHSEEPVPFASVEFIKLKRGGVTDSTGRFTIYLKAPVKDSLIVTYVGYARAAVPVAVLKDSLQLTISLERAVSGGVVIKSKRGRGWVLWRKIVKNKDLNDKGRFNNYSYELYNKLELDFNKIDKEKLGSIKLLKPFSFLLKNVDTTEFSTPVLPIFLTETISDYYYQRSPRKTRETIRASKTNGINNESVTKLLGGMYQNVNVYGNFIPVFDKDFISPISDNGDAWYDYSIPDTQYISGRRYYHWVFTPRRKGENTFEGDAWIHDTSFSVQRITMHLSKDANVNFLENLSIFQEFHLISDSTWFLSKDKFIADVYPIGKNKMGLKGRKTSTYRNVLINQSSVADTLKKNRIMEEVMVSADAEMQADTFWKNSRHEELNKSEKSIYAMIDTLENMPLFQKYRNTLDFVAGGYKRLGNITIGPWFNWLSTNTWEGTRTRFDVQTNSGFNKKLKFRGYAAYGFGDEVWKGGGEVLYIPQKHPRMSLNLLYQNDLDNGPLMYDDISQDNIFTFAIRKPGIFRKFLKSKETRFEFFKETLSGFSARITVSSKQYTPLRGLPLKSELPAASYDQLNNFETSIKLRYAFLERFLENAFYRTSLGSDKPIVELKYAHGWSGVFSSSYKYDKVHFSIHDWVKIPPNGELFYNAYVGKVWGTLPYMLLEMHPGNDLYYYNKYVFNLMNRFEYISDTYAGAQVEHNFGNRLFRLIPLTRKLKIRQFWNAKLLVGNLSDANTKLNFVGNHSFKALNGKSYLELGTGIDNILKVLRVDFVWRVLPQPLPTKKIERFGVFGSFRLAF
jgi:Family of unknown function (DUF5686)/CarboxypepD_reg-like domain